MGHGKDECISTRYKRVRKVWCSLQPVVDKEGKVGAFPTQGQGRGMEGRRQSQGYKTMDAKTESANLGHGQSIEVRLGLIKLVREFRRGHCHVPQCLGGATWEFSPQGPLRRCLRAQETSYQSL